ncbi:MULTISPECIES: thioredoxin [Gardnerella]|uniref:Thioredoxin n=2 Tax=Gardnerella TaxID=2701 RepID=A0A3E1IWZ6_GARVA|nr:thioredoxin [Gardnerella vaginalis]MDK6471589.1 thioredoxin [Bifidobacterium sp. UMB9259]MDK7188894.1 thioredoxin [Bifidobacterium sp. UMB1230]RFD77248.1 thioredoxin [Gardnerella vaginalis]RFT41854.1 thioredoxin [Bifidobacteriaceae bacterium N170]
MALIHATQEDFEKIASTNEVVVVDFWATWCGPCRAFGPIFEQVSAKFEDVPFVKVDIDQSPDLASAAAIKAVPTVMVIKRGDVIYRQAGALLPADLEDLVNQAKAYDPSKDDENNKDDEGDSVSE